MANTYSQIYMQTVFAVKYREAVLDKKWRSEIFAIMGNLINEAGCKTFIVKGVEDHVHCFFGMKAKHSASEIMKIVKAKSSKYINENNLTKNRFEWQSGFGAFSYNPESIDNVFKYIKNQEEHHEKENFKLEYLEMLERYLIPFDERYIFEDLK